MRAPEATLAPPMLTLRTTSGAQARICTQGAQVMSWTHRGRERLFTSPQAVFQPGQAIRGGIPVIFPQFGARGPGPRHGFARLLAWEPVATAAPDRAILRLRHGAGSLRWWPFRFGAEIDVQLLENALSTSLTISNRDDAGFDFTAALHTYLQVSDIEDAGLVGLQGRPYIDAANGSQPGLQSEEILRFAGEVDRIYPDGGRDLVLRDAAGALEIHSDGFPDTVVWNPGAALGDRLADMGAGNHARFVCVEAASVETAVHLAPGASWRGTQRLTCSED